MTLDTLRAVVCVLVALSPGASVSSATQPAQSPTLVGNEDRGAKPGWTNVVPGNHMRQSFTAPGSVVTSVAIALVVANKRGDRDRIRIQIYDTNGVLRAESQRVVTLGDVGWVRFDLPNQGLATSAGEVLVMEVSDTGKVLFGWQYTRDQYVGGHAWIIDRECPDLDFLFVINPPEELFRDR